MHRRSFIRSLAATGGAGLLMPAWAAAAAPHQCLRGHLAGAVFHTREAPGRWGAKVDGHLPQLEAGHGSDGGLRVQVVTGHEMKGYEHYIVKHLLFDGEFNFLAEHRFDPEQDGAPVSTFELRDYSGTLYALSVCNLHDTWLNGLEV